MGVQGLWDLLAPVGRRVSVETLAGKKLAIDASIWMVQFMKAMRDERGEMVRNAHLIGFFRRICKLLYLKTKPVFVFDGGTPALKRRTVIARRRQRENAQAKIRKTAEKLLINHLKTMRLKELAKDLENQRQKQKSDSKGKKILSDLESNSERSDALSASNNRENLDEMLAASIVAEANDSLSKSLSESATAFDEDGDEDEDEDEDEEIILPTMDGYVDPAVLAALPPSMQTQILVQKNDANGKRILSEDTDQANMVENNLIGNDVISKSHDHEKLDEMLAASIAIEEERSLTNNASTSVASFLSEEEDCAEDEEMILPEMHGNVDPAVLAALPPSMQLDLLVQMRERLMAENRQKYQKVKKAPEKFSELQIQAYLKTVSFRREIDEVQKAAAGRGVGGVQTSRIASEANREFIFSSSFTGSKQVLATSRVESKGDEQQIQPQQPSSDSMNNVASIDKSDAVGRLVPEESKKGFDDSVETYLDERGCLRVSRFRAMGIRMTRDIERNLDVMKEIEHEIPNGNKITEAKSTLNLNKTTASKSLSMRDKFVETSCDDSNESLNSIERNKLSMFKIKKSIEISFEDKNENKSDDDDIFAHLASGNPLLFPDDNSPSQKQSFDSMSDDDDWEEGIIGTKGTSFSNDVDARIKSPLNLKESNASDESEVEWEEGPSSALKSSCSIPAESGKIVSRGYIEEEAALQEAMRRSLLDLCSEKDSHVLAEHEKSTNFGENAPDGTVFQGKGKNMANPNFLAKNVTQQNELLFKNVGLEKLDGGGVNNTLVIDSVALNPNDKGMLINKSCEKRVDFPSGQSKLDTSDGKSSCRDVPHAEVDTTVVVKGQDLTALNEGDGHFTYVKKCSEDCSHNGDVVFGDASDSILVDNKKNNCKPEISILTDDEKNEPEVEASIMINGKKNDSLAEPLFHKIGTIDPSISMAESFRNATMYNIDIEHKLAAESASVSCLESGDNIEKSAINENENAEVKVTDSMLEEEMLILDQECMSLGNEQKKLERNAESVSNEMFAECQELLQMFGLPYIIAPMEAEAQCAYLELTNLVDGVVTDDSDVFLFGAQSVYKNIFDDRKYVETYFMQDIEKELGLTREKVIRMALLLGSDYTEGISGIGIVNAIEVVNAFPEEDGLKKFREWIESPDPTILGKFDVQTGSNSRKRQSGVGDNDVKQTKNSVAGVPECDESASQSDEDKSSADYRKNTKKIFMDKHRNVSKNWHIPSSFPSEAVISAYSCPLVDKSTEPFSWGKPDLFVLRKFCWDKFGWGSDKVNELLLPVLKEYEKRETQLRLEAFYTFNERFAKIRSKRIKKAVKGITGNQSQELVGVPVQKVTKTRKRRISCPENGDNQSQKASKEPEDIVDRTRINNMKKSTARQSRKRKVSKKLLSSDMEKPEQLLQADGRSTIKGSSRNRRDTDQKVGRGKEGGRPHAELSKTSSSDGIGGGDKQEFYAEELERPQGMQRSTHSRKPVNYNANDPKLDDVDKILNDEECSKKRAMEQDFRIYGVCGDGPAVLIGNKQHRTGDCSLEEGSCRGCLESGGGFYIDEDKIGQRSVSLSDDPFPEVEISKDYLKVGGGFWVEESKTCDAEVAVQDPVITGENPSSCFDSVDRVDCDIASGNPTSSSEGAISGTHSGKRTIKFDTEHTLVHENATSTGNVENDAERAPGGALTAMRFLRRKRRRG